MTKLTEERIKELASGRVWAKADAALIQFARAIEAELQPNPVISRLLTEWKTGKKNGEEVCCELFHRFPSNPSNEQPVQEPVSFYIYKETAPRLNLPNVVIYALPWVYDQDPSSGFSARLKVYLAPPDQPNKLDLIAVTEANDKLNELCRDQTAEIERLRHDLMVRETAKDERIATLEAELSALKDGDVVMVKKCTQAERSWPEDSPHENGEYFCTCHRCQRQFIGHKRRVTCKVCDAMIAAAPGVQAGEKDNAAMSGAEPASSAERPLDGTVMQED
jgi:hypothetical protein